MGSKFKTHILRLAFVCVEGIFLLLSLSAAYSSNGRGSSDEPKRVCYFSLY